MVAYTLILPLYLFVLVAYAVYYIRLPLRLTQIEDLLEMTLRGMPHSMLQYELSLLNRKEIDFLLYRIQRECQFVLKSI